MTGEQLLAEEREALDYLHELEERDFPTTLPSSPTSHLTPPSLPSPPSYLSSPCLPSPPSLPSPPPLPPLPSPPPLLTSTLISSHRGEKRKRRAMSPRDIRQASNSTPTDLLDRLSQEDQEMVRIAAMVGVTGDRVINPRHFNSQRFRTPQQVCC